MPKLFFLIMDVAKTFLTENEEFSQTRLNEICFFNMILSETNKIK